MSKQRERTREGMFAKSHGMRRTRIYYTWCAIKQRCSNPNDKSYQRYGARGITMCDEWANSFKSFWDWATAHGYKEGLTIDRINNDMGYSPENCRWVTTKEQNRNYSRNHKITYAGQTKCICEWAEETGVNRATILWRLNNGKSLENVFKKIDGRSERWKKTIL